MLLGILLIMILAGFAMYIGSKELYMRYNRNWITTPVKQRSQIPPSIALVGLLMALAGFAIRAVQIVVEA